jgi:hypothetical protein
MSDLQIGLAVIGAFVIGAVIAYNKWQEGRVARRADRDFGSRHPDVLVSRTAAGAEPPEPDAPRATAVAGVASRAAAVERVEHTMGDVDAPPVPHTPAFEADWASDRAPLDARVDCVATLALGQPISGAEALAAGVLADEGVTKPVRWEGERADGGWEPVEADGTYRSLRAGLQLADRNGPATAQELGVFVKGMQDVAATLSAELAAPDVGGAAGQAVALDEFCADVDVQIGLNVIATETQPFAGTKLRALAEAGGLRLGDDGAFHRYDDHGHELYSLSNGGDPPFTAEGLRALATQAVTVTLDVPRAPGSTATFRLYLDFARQLEQALGGMLVDDNRKPVGQAALDRIGRQLERIYGQMDARGIPAGSPAAQRLFS